MLYDVNPNHSIPTKFHSYHSCWFNHQLTNWLEILNPIDISSWSIPKIVP